MHSRPPSAGKSPTASSPSTGSAAVEATALAAPKSGVSPQAHGHWLVLVIVCFAQFMVVLDATIVNVALPSIQDGLKLSGPDLQWVVNAYTLVFGGFLLLGGRLADLSGRRKLFIAGSVLFAGASAINAIAQSGEMLILARGLQGLGGALISPAALSIITTSYEEGPERTKALAVWGAIAAGGAALGLLLGGILTETLNWRWNFIVNLPIGVLVVLAALKWVPESHAEVEHRHFDVGGAITVTSGLVTLVYAIVKAQEWGWGSPKMLAWIAGAMVLLIAFVIIELRSPAPLVRLSFFTKRWITAANLTMFAVAGGMMSMFFFCSLYIQQIMGFGPMKAGFAFLPASLSVMVSAGIAQQIMGRIGVKTVACIGVTMAAIGLSILAVMTQIDGTYPQLLIGLVTMALGMGMTFVPLTLVATAGVDDADAGLASGMFNTSQQIGGALGLAALATLASDKTESVLTGLHHRPGIADHQLALVEGFQTAFTAAAGLMVFGLLMLVILLSKRDVANVHVGRAELAAATA